MWLTVAEEAGDAVDHAEVLVGVEGDDLIPGAVVADLNRPGEDRVRHCLLQ